MTRPSQKAITIASAEERYIGRVLKRTRRRRSGAALWQLPDSLLGRIVPRGAAPFSMGLDQKTAPTGLRVALPLELGCDLRP
jgi:hypothetical protein